MVVDCGFEKSDRKKPKISKKNTSAPKEKPCIREATNKITSNNTISIHHHNVRWIAEDVENVEDVTGILPTARWEVVQSVEVEMAILLAVLEI